MDYKEKAKRLIEKSKTDAILLFNESNESSNFLYMTGFTSGVFEDTPLIIAEGKSVLFASMLEYGIAKRDAPPYLEVEEIKAGKELRAKLESYTKGKTIGFDGSSLSYSAYWKIRKIAKPARMVDVSKDFAEMRAIKDEKELSYIKKANAIAKAAFEEVQDSFAEGITEKEIAAKFDYLAGIHGSEKPAFDTIVCFGKNAALPHHMPDSTKLKSNEFILIDAGAKYKNYCSDLSRTYIFKPDKGSSKYKRMQDMLETVKEAQLLAKKEAYAGNRSDKPHIAAEEYINKKSNGIYNGKFIHALGHSIGIDVHDSSYLFLSKGTNAKLQKNMVFSDEPGIYIEGFGGVRIEDDMVVTENGGVFL